MSWRDRVRQTITLESPEGNVFEALWVADSRSMEKKLGIFNFPKVKGSVVQDLDIGAVKYPIPLYFEGEDCDIEADKFFKSAGERGIWQITHPVKGDLALQLVSISETINPTESGNMIAFDTEWIEPIGALATGAGATSVVASASQLQAEIDQSLPILNEVAAIQAEATVLQETAAQIASFRNAVTRVRTAVETTLSPLYETVSEINSQITTITSSIDEAMAIIPMDILSIAGQIQQMIQIPSLAITNIETRLATYRNFAEQIFGDDISSGDEDNINVAAVQELSLTSVINAFAFSSSTGEIESRAGAVEIIESNQTYFSDMTEHLDNAQTQFVSNFIDRQYFSQSQSFGTASLLTSKTIEYLLRTIFDLKVEKRFILKKQRAPIEIAIAEYGSLGNNDENFDLFISTNALKGNDIFILPAGREVMVYA